MIKNILAFGASSSKYSINKQLANYIAHSIPDSNVDLLDLNDFEMPIFSIDKEIEGGIPTLALDFKSKIKDCDGIVISFAEHNGAYSAAFKNIFDWISRIEDNVWANKPMFLAATSPGGRGGASVLEIAVNKFSRMTKGGIVSFSLPSFHDNLDKEKGILNSELEESLRKAINEFDKELLA